MFVAKNQHAIGGFRQWRAELFVAAGHFSMTPVRRSELSREATKMTGGRWRSVFVLTLFLVALPIPLAAEGGRHAPSEALFLTEIIALLVCGRLLGEAMQRIGQPAVMGQLLAGVLLGPSVLGAVLPELQQALFPASHDQKS